MKPGGRGAARGATARCDPVARPLEAPGATLSPGGGSPLARPEAPARDRRPSPPESQLPSTGPPGAAPSDQPEPAKPIAAPSDPPEPQPSDPPEPQPPEPQPPAPEPQPPPPEPALARDLQLGLPPPEPPPCSPLGELVDLPALQRTAEALHAATGIPFSLIGTDGAIYVGAGWQDICMRFHRRHPETLQACIDSDTRIGELISDGIAAGCTALGAGEPLAPPASAPGGAYGTDAPVTSTAGGSRDAARAFYLCPNGLRDAAVPLIVDGHHLANVFTGQFLLDEDEVDREAFRERARRCGFDESEYLAALDRVPVFPRERVEHMLDYLQGFVHMLATSGAATAQRDRALTELAASRDCLAHDYRRQMLVDRVAGELLGETHEDAIYGALGHAVTELLPEVVVLVLGTEADGRSIRLVKAFGLGAAVDRVLAILPRDPYAMRLDVQCLPPEEREAFGSGRLLKLEGGVQEGAMGALNRPLARAVERLLGVRQVWRIGLARDERHFGGLLLLAPADADVEPEVAAVETLVRQASIALQKAAAVRALEASEERYRSIFEDAILGLYRTTPDGRFENVNAAFAHIYGYDSPQQMLAEVQDVGRRLYASQEDREEFARRLAAEGELHDTEIEQVRRDGTHIWVRSHDRVVRDASGAVRYFEGTVEDITAEHLAESALTESEARFRTYVQSAPDGIFVVDVQGRYLDCNPAAGTMVGRTCDELLSMSVADMMVPSGAAAAAAGFAELVRTGGLHQEIELLHKDGSEVTVQLDAVALGDGRFIGFCKDVSLRKAAEEQARHAARQLGSAAERLRRALEETIAAMGAIIETRDPYTAGHERRVTALSTAMAEHLGMPEERVTAVKLAAEVHDIGKIAVPAEILSKPGRLTPMEYDIVRQHPVTAHAILGAVEFPWPLAEIVLQHHERLDGSGYPGGLTGEQILPEARVLAVADVVEAMASHRPYRPALGMEAALAEIESGRGTLYDAAAVDACVAVIREGGFELPDGDDVPHGNARPHAATPD
jgi:PAS domain S-box-containing protein